MIFPLHSSLFVFVFAISTTNAAVAALNLADFLVKGDSLPVLKEKIQDSYSGKLSVSASQDELEHRVGPPTAGKRRRLITAGQKLFFWYFPSSTDAGGDSLTIWLGSGSLSL